jgi:hypothetical protein
MNEFETRLHECLEALREGRWSLDECLQRYPEHAIELRAQLLTASAVSRAYHAAPREEWVTAARERFLIATGQRIQEAMDLEPEPSFFAAARLRFLMAAQRLRSEGSPTRRVRQLPLFGSPMRAFGAAAAALVLFLGFSTYTVASASAALPGDWRYPIKLQTERVRLALAFSEGQERDVKLDIAEERVEEIEKLAQKGKIIPPGALDRLVKQTVPLVEDASAGRLDLDETARLQQVSIRSSQVLNAVAPQADPAAQAKLDAAKDISEEALDVTFALMIADPERPPIVLTPQTAVRTPTPEPTIAATDTPQDPTAEATTSSSPEPVETTAPSDNGAPTDSVVLSDEPIIDFPGVTLHVVQAGRLILNAPGPGSGWYIENAPSTGIPTLLTFKTQDQQSFVVVSTMTGDMYWYISPARNGRYDEVQLRITRNEEVFVADAASLEKLYGADARIPILMMQSVRLLPDPVPPTPTPAATEPASTTSQ